MQEGEDGDYFYVLESGECEVYLSKVDDGTTSVMKYTDGSSFGELALMYNCPRAATVKASSASSLWVLDRGTFRHMLSSDQNSKRKKQVCCVLCAVLCGSAVV